MGDIGVNNLLSIVIGIIIILTCCSIAYFFQKHLFNKYKNKVSNAKDKDNRPT